MAEELKPHHYWREDRITGRLVVITPDEYEQWGKDNQPSEAYRPAFTRAQVSQGGEAVEVVAWANPADLVQDGYSHSFGVSSEEYAGREPLMTVAQHQRILAASVGSAEPVAWREHSVNYAKGEKCPETIETLQAAWDRDQELINDMRHEIARHKTRINRLEQRRPAGQVADDLTRVKVPRELLERLYRVHKPTMLDRDIYELRALLNGGRS